MTILIDKKRCNGCRQLPEPRCVQNCPGDLLALGAEGKAFIWEERDCWDCMTCVKLCPRRAITTKLPYVIADYKATLVPIPGKGSIRWVLTDRAGRVEEFHIVTLEPRRAPARKGESR